MTATDTALASVKGADHLSIAGRGLSADLALALTGASTTLTTEGASTLALTLRDPRRKLLNSGIFGTGMLVRLDGFPFVLVSVGKSGPEVSLTFEHEAVNDSDEPRIVLIFDVWNCFLAEAERDLLAALISGVHEYNEGESPFRQGG